MDELRNQSGRGHDANLQKVLTLDISSQLSVVIRLGFAICHDDLQELYICQHSNVFHVKIEINQIIFRLQYPIICYFILIALYTNY